MRLKGSCGWPVTAVASPTQSNGAHSTTTRPAEVGVVRGDARPLRPRSRRVR